MVRLSQTSKSFEDVFDIACFLNEHNSSRIADEFLSAVQDAFELIQKHPEIGEIWESLPGIRKKLLVRFKVLVFYKYDEDLSIVTISRVLHGSKDLSQLSFDDL